MTTVMAGVRARAKIGYDAADQLARRLDAKRILRTEPGLFDRLERYCQFIGFPRSGHSLIGALLDSHPDMMVSHESDALGQIAMGADREVLFANIVRRDRAFVARGFEQSGDVYDIPGQWQGRVRRLRVVGDKTGGGSSLHLAQDPTLLDQLRSIVGVPLRVIVVVRNPFDNVARISTRGELSLLAAAAHYQKMATAVDAALAGLLPGEALVVPHEETVADPQHGIRRMAKHLEVDAPDDWVEAAASIVLPSPRRARGDVEWTTGTRTVVEEMIERFEFLRGYSLDD